MPCNDSYSFILFLTLPERQAQYLLVGYVVVVVVMSSSLLVAVVVFLMEVVVLLLLLLLLPCFCC